MLKMARAGKYHRHFIFVAIINAQLVLNGTTGLDNSGYACFVGNFDAIGKREKSVARHHGAL